MTRSRLLPLLFILGSSFTVLAQQTPAFPYEPAQLLTALPEAPTEWTVTRSEADNTLGNWVQTRATRVFQAPPASSANAPATAPAKPGEIEISVKDTAGFAPSLVEFADFTPGRNGNVEKKLLGSLRAIIFTNEDRGQFFQVLVSNRYIIEITPSRLPQFRIEDWLRSFHFDRLPATSSAPTTRTSEFHLTHVDELDPKNNRSYSVSVTNSQRVADFVKTLPPEPAEAAQSK